MTDKNLYGFGTDGKCGTVKDEIVWDGGLLSSWIGLAQPDKKSLEMKTIKVY